MFRYIGYNQININDLLGKHKDTTVIESGCNTTLLKKAIIDVLQLKIININHPYLSFYIEGNRLKTVVTSKEKLKEEDIMEFESDVCTYYLKGPGADLNLRCCETFFDDSKENGWIAGIQRKNDEVYFKLEQN